MLKKRVFSQIINNKHKDFYKFDNLCYEVKNSYNYANYICRQAFAISHKKEENISYLSHPMILKQLSV